MRHLVYHHTTYIGSLDNIPDKGWRFNCIPEFARYSTPHGKHYKMAEDAIPEVLRVLTPVRIEYD